MNVALIKSLDYTRPVPNFPSSSSFNPSTSFSCPSVSHQITYLGVAQGGPPHVQDGQMVIGPVARVVNEGLGRDIQADLVSRIWSL